MFEQQTQNEDAATRTVRVDRAIAHWRKLGACYVTLSPTSGRARPHPAGTLGVLMRIVAQHPGAQLVELAAPDARQQILKWALECSPLQQPGVN